MPGGVNCLWVLRATIPPALKSGFGQRDESGYRGHKTSLGRFHALASALNAQAEPC
jgi:hypothetical protein